MASKMTEIDRGAKTLRGVTVSITETVWHGGGRSFDLNLPDGTCLTEDESLDEYPTDDEIIDLIPTEMLHTDQGHEPGYLYGCRACEASCFCEPGFTQCVHHDLMDANEI